MLVKQSILVIAYVLFLHTQNINFYSSTRGSSIVALNGGLAGCRFFIMLFAIVYTVSIIITAMIVAITYTTIINGNGTLIDNNYMKLNCNIYIIIQYTVAHKPIMITT
jgi:hypothetical protein